MTTAFQGDAFQYDAFQILGIVAESNVHLPEGQICAKNSVSAIVAHNSAELIALNDLAAIVATHTTRCCARECS